jgi:hypothetical protein
MRKARKIETAEELSERQRLEARARKFEATASDRAIDAMVRRSIDIFGARAPPHPATVLFQTRPAGTRWLYARAPVSCLRVKIHFPTAPNPCGNYILDVGKGDSPLCKGQAGALPERLRAELVADVGAALSAYYDAVSPQTVAEEIVDLISSKLCETGGIRQRLKR